jgi:catechol 2,3-dioxygenase-like lactoylglutathione lyase family enzyme
MWTPLEVADFAAAVAFYEGVLGLPRIDGWQRDGERGAVFGVGEDGRLEIVSPRTDSPPPKTAIELPHWSDGDRLAALLRRAPKVFPRGHYGFVTNDPDGHPLLVWSEATQA